MKGNELITALKTRFRVTTDKALGEHLGLSTHALHNWKGRARVTKRQVCGLIVRASRAGATNLGTKAIRPIVEFFPIDKAKSTQNNRYELFTVSDGGKNHPYRSGLREELETHHGIYIFFDSRGQAIYAGKARRQKIWREMKLAFNRARGDIQKIKRVRQPVRKQAYRTSNEKARQIRDVVVPLYELAAYFSAYEVADSMINELEAMLVRSFANDLLNKRMERFGQQRRAAGNRRGRKRDS